MKNKLFLFACLLLGFAMNAQITFEATNNHGRLQDITYDPLIPNKVYALSNAGNHVLVSVDNMQSWSILYSLPNSDAQLSKLKLLDGNAALSFMVSNTEMLVDDGVYIFNLTTNSISNYYPIPNLSDNPRIVSYDISDASGTTIILHDTYSEGLIGLPITKIYYSNTSGNTWNLIYSSLNNDDVSVNNVAFSPNNSEKIFLTRSFSPGDVDGGLLISEDAGATWVEKLPGVVLEPIAFHPLTPNEIIIGTAIAFGTVAENLYRSTDGGDTWTILPNTWNGNEFMYNNINKIVYHPSNPDTIIVLEENEIAVTFDSGATWTNTPYIQNDSNSYWFGLNASFNPFMSGQVAISSPYYSQISTDFGVTVTQLESPFCNTTSVSSASYGTSEHLYYGAQGGRIHKNLSTGTFNASYILNSFEYSLPKNFVVADPVIPGRTFSYKTSGFFGGNLYLSTDYGVTNTLLFSNFSDDIRVVSVDPANSNVIYVSFRFGEGSSIQKIDFSDLNNVIASEIITPGIYIDGEGNGVVSGIVISSTDPQILYVSQRNKFYISIDGGLTWEERINGLDLGTYEIIWNMNQSPFDENHFTLATQNGIYITTDAGLNWVQTYNEKPTHKVKYSPLNPGVIAIGTKRYGSVLYSLDNGNSWSEINEAQLAHLATQDVDFTFSGNTINAYFATIDLGIVGYKIENLSLSVETPLFDQDAISVYPNPASDIVNVVLPNDSEVKTIQVHTISGQKVFETESSTFTISSLNTGVYILKVITADGRSFSQKLIKK